MEKSIAFPLCSSARVETLQETNMSTRVSIPKGLAMDNWIKIKHLDDLPDGVLLWDRVYDGQEGAILIIVNIRTYAIVIGTTTEYWPWWFIPMDKCAPLVTMFESEGLHLSYG
jgi:hypothetical protein